MSDSKSQTTADCTWEEHERRMYCDITFCQKRDKVAAVLGTFVSHRDLPNNWPGTIRIANAIMEALQDV